MSAHAPTSLLFDPITLHVPQSYTTASAAMGGVAGSQLAVAPSYQLTYSSAAFAAVGTWQGHTFRKQFDTAFSVSSLQIPKPHCMTVCRQRLSWDPGICCCHCLAHTISAVPMVAAWPHRDIHCSQTPTHNSVENRSFCRSRCSHRG